MKADILYYSRNELRSGVPQLLQAAESAPDLPLDYGWICPDQSEVHVERKTLQDLAASLRNSHLRDQLEQAKADNRHLFLVVEGWSKLNDYSSNAPLLLRGGNWYYQPFMAALISILHGLQVQLLPCGGPDNTAMSIQTLFEMTRRERLGNGRPALSKWQHTKRNTMAESYARAIPNLGFERAKRLESKFKTWELLLKATQRQLRAVDGIGPLLSERIYKFLRGRK